MALTPLQMDGRLTPLRTEGNQKGDEKRRENGNGEVTQTLSINIYVGDPLDLQTARHTGFFIQWSDGDNLIIHVMGSHQFYELQEIWNGPKPNVGDGCIRDVPVATWTTSEEEKFKLRNIIRDTPINNAERGWNCQNWIGDALQILEARGFLSHAAIQAAGDAMVDTILEAKDGE